MKSFSILGTLFICFFGNSCFSDRSKKIEETQKGIILDNHQTDTMPVPQLKGFILERLSVPLEEIQDGGPPKDGIPSIDFPQFVAAEEDTFLKPNDLVLGLSLNGVTTAYPVRILNYHEIVNDRFGNQAVVVTYCPLCGSGVAFIAGEKERERFFGVSGLLYNSDLLMYDRTTESLWSQIMGRAISGPLSGTVLQALPTEQTTWSDWRNRYPQTMVLSTNTGHRRNYTRSPYLGYAKKEDIYFPVNAIDERFSNKEKVIGVEVNGRYKAYPFSKLEREENPVVDSFNGKKLWIDYNPAANSARVTNEDGQAYPGLTLFWFAWYAFHPQTLVY